MYFCANFLEMTIHKEGYPTIIVIALLAFITSEMSYLYFSTFGFVFVLATTLSILGVVLFFFRNPVKRKCVTAEDGIIAPADGTVVAVEKVQEKEFFNDERIQVSIFMSVFNVHKNFFPVSGEVTYYKHHNGNFKRAVLPKSSCENERSSIAVKRESGDEILFRQVAGAMARRIVSYVEIGKPVEQATEMGFIKFGSRVDVFLPVDADVKVKLGDKTVGSQTLLATL